MEYPFKDLLPLDEVLAREGYYKDWTHLDPEVFYSLTQISNFIKTKGYGVDVRLLIAQLAEHFGLKTAQVVDLGNLLQAEHATLKQQVQQAVAQVNADRNALETQFNQSVAQMEADKNTIVANATVDSEVILARGGKPTLQARLDETATQLAQIAINVKSFGAKGDGVTDDTLAIQSAISNLSDNTSLLLPYGKYVVSSVTIDNIKHLKIFGQGELISNSNSHVLSLVNCSNVSIDGIVINGNKIALRGLHLSNCQHITVGGISIFDIGENHTHATGISITDISKFITIKNTDIKNVVSTSVSAGVSITMDANENPCQFIYFDNLTVDTVLPISDSDGIKVLQTSNNASKGLDSFIYINNSKFFNCAKRALKLQASECHVDNCYSEGEMAYSGIDFQMGYGSVKNSTFKFTSDNTFIGCYVGGANVEIIKNKFINSDISFTSQSQNLIRGISIGAMTSDTSMKNLIIKDNELRRWGRNIHYSNSPIMTFDVFEVVNNIFEQFSHANVINSIGSTIGAKIIKLNDNKILSIPVGFNGAFPLIVFSDNTITTHLEAINNTIEGMSDELNALTHTQIIPRISVCVLEWHNFRYKNLTKTILQSFIPTSTTSSANSVFIATKKSDVVLNTNPTALTDANGTYYIEKWVCVEDSVLTEGTWSVGTWVPLKIYVE